MSQRLFVSLPLPQQVRDALDVSARTLTVGDQPVFRQVAKGSLHVTLYFLGNLDEQAADSVRQVLSSVQAQPFPLATGQIVRLPSDDVPKVVAMTLSDPDGGLARIQRRIHDGVYPFAENKETRPFLAHVTLARLVPGVPGYAKPVKRCLESFRSVRRIGWDADRIDLLSSKPGDGGPAYETLASFPFGG